MLNTLALKSFVESLEDESVVMKTAIRVLSSEVSELKSTIKNPRPVLAILDGERHGATQPRKEPLCPFLIAYRGARCKRQEKMMHKSPGDGTLHQRKDGRWKYRAIVGLAVV